MNECRICNNAEQNCEYTIKEMMLGMRSEFTYFQCSNCECLQIATIPEQISIYYPLLQYYSFGKVEISTKLLVLKKFILWLKLNLRGKVFLSILRLLGSKIWNYYLWISFVKGVSLNSKILDVGCGSGSFLYELRELGFKNLYGIDPNISENIEDINISKKEIYDVYGKFDLITLHHSLEHMPNQDCVIKKINDLLDLGGALLIRIPVVDCFAWRAYGESWYQIDAPRHFYIHSSISLEKLASRHGFELLYSYRDSSGLQFSISEMYAKNIASNQINLGLLAEKAKLDNKRAAQLNKKNDGDQACFIFKKIANA